MLGIFVRLSQCRKFVLNQHILYENPKIVIRLYVVYVAGSGELVQATWRETGGMVCCNPRHSPHRHCVSDASLPHHPRWLQARQHSCHSTVSSAHWYYSVYACVDRGVLESIDVDLYSITRGNAELRHMFTRITQFYLPSNTIHTCLHSPTTMYEDNKPQDIETLSAGIWWRNHCTLYSVALETCDWHLTNFLKSSLSTMDTGRQHETMRSSTVDLQNRF